MCLFHKWKYYFEKDIRYFKGIEYTDFRVVFKECRKCGVVMGLDDTIRMFGELNSKETEIFKKCLKKDLYTEEYVANFKEDIKCNGIIKPPKEE